MNDIFAIEIGENTYVDKAFVNGQYHTWESSNQAQAEATASYINSRVVGSVLDPGVCVVQITHVVEELVINDNQYPEWIPIDEGSWNTIYHGVPVIGHFRANTGWCKARLASLHEQKPNLMLRLRDLRYLKIEESDPVDVAAYLIDGKLVDLEFDYRAEITRLYMAYRNKDLRVIKDIIERCYDPALYAQMLGSMEEET